LQRPIKVLRVDQGPHKFTAAGILALINDRHREMIDRLGRGIRVHEQLDERQAQDEDEKAPVTEDLNGFLADQRPQTLQVDLHGSSPINPISV
jgi:hypothetical protein